jgi:hypothetical protein
VPGAIRTFQNPGGSLLRLNDVIVFRREPVRPPRFNSQSFRFGVAVAREKMIHFSLEFHFYPPFLFFGLSHGKPGSLHLCAFALTLRFPDSYCGAAGGRFSAPAVIAVGGLAVALLQLRVLKCAPTCG